MAGWCGVARGASWVRASGSGASGPAASRMSATARLRPFGNAETGAVAVIGPDGLDEPPEPTTAIGVKGRLLCRRLRLGDGKQLAATSR